MDIANNIWQWNGDGLEYKANPNAFLSLKEPTFLIGLRLVSGCDDPQVLETEQAKSWEATLFGAINPQKRGWVMVRISSGKVTHREPRPNNQGKDDPCGEQQGILTLAYSSAAPTASQGAIADLFKNLTWLMFHLGGIGQGARRPCYSRHSRDSLRDSFASRAPWYRGSTLFPDSKDSFWSLPATPANFGDLFRQRLQDFYQALSCVTDININPRSLKTVGHLSVQHLRGRQ